LFCRCLISASPYEGGPALSFCDDDKRSMHMYMQGMIRYRLPSGSRYVDCESVNKKYIDLIARQGAQQLRKKVQPYLDKKCRDKKCRDKKCTDEKHMEKFTVAINFLVRGGLVAVDAYTQEFNEEIKTGAVKWGTFYLSFTNDLNPTCHIDVRGMADGDVITHVYDWFDTGLMQCLGLSVIQERFCTSKKIIMQSLMQKRSDELTMCWQKGDYVRFNVCFNGASAKDRIAFMDEAFHILNVDTQLNLDDLDFSIVDENIFIKDRIILPYTGSMPGMWPAVHDCLVSDHKKGLIVTPAIVYCDADGRATKVDYELALCQSYRSDCLTAIRGTAGVQRVIYATILVREGLSGQVTIMSPFLHMQHADLLKEHASNTVMVLPKNALKNKALVSALSDYFEMPVNSKSSDDMPCIYSDCDLIYNSAQAFSADNPISLRLCKRPRWQSPRDFLL